MKLYFAYGANLNIDSMANRCPDAVAIQSYHLTGWRLMFSGVATIVSDPDSYVPGALWAISESDELALDQFEGWPTLYRKEIIHTDGLEFMVYLMNAEQPCEPSVNYVMTIAQGYQDWTLDIQDLNEAVQRTQEEQYQNDLYQYNCIDTGSVGYHRDIIHDLSFKSCHDLCQPGDPGLAHRNPEAV